MDVAGRPLPEEDIVNQRILSYPKPGLFTLLGKGNFVKMIMLQVCR